MTTNSNSNMRYYLTFLLVIIATNTKAFAYTSINTLKKLDVNIHQCTPNNAHKHKNLESITLINIKQNQSLCLHTTITLNESLTNQALVVKMLAARKIYWDGQLIVEDGVVGQSAQTTKAGPIRSITPMNNALLTAGEHTLTLVLANYHIGEPVSASIYALYLTDIKQAYTSALYQTLTPSIMIGALIIIALFFQAIYWLYQSSASYQIFSLLCFFASLLIISEHFRAWYAYPYTWHITRLHLITALTFVSLLLLNWFYLSFYAFSKTKQILAIVCSLLVVALFIDPRYDAKSILMFLISMFSCLTINIIAYRGGQQQARFGCGLFATILVILALSPLSVFYRFIEQWFTIIHIAIVLSIMTSLITQMQNQRRQAITAARLELDLLRRNLQPHFLMNSLTLIIEWIEIKPQAAVKFVDALAQNLRDLVQFSTQSTISLTDEINLCRQHLTVMGYRYDCQYYFEVNGQFESLEVAPAIILTQIENAFAHNRIAPNSQFTFDINKQQNKVTLELRSPYLPNIRNKRKDSTNNNLNDGGTGEKYIHARLRELHGTNYQYKSYAKDEQWINRISYRTK